MKVITILDIAIAKGAQKDDAGRLGGGEFERLGLPMISGCQRCGATVGPWGACPSRTGFIQCCDCITDDLAFATVADFDAFEKSNESDD